MPTTGSIWMLLCSFKNLSSFGYNSGESLSEGSKNDLVQGSSVPAISPCAMEPHITGKMEEEGRCVPRKVSRPGFLFVNVGGRCYVVRSR